MSRHEYSVMELETIRNAKKKTCTLCHGEKDVYFFGKSAASVDGRCAQCSECQRNRQTIIRMVRKITTNFS